jgi:hypothetical protein
VVLPDGDAPVDLWVDESGVSEAPLADARELPCTRRRPPPALRISSRQATTNGAPDRQVELRPPPVG